MNSTDPKHPSGEPSDEASNHADMVQKLWNKVRDLAGPLRPIFKELKDHEASGPSYESCFHVYPCDWLDSIDALMTADFTGCWDDDAAAWDKQADDNARQLADELRGGE